jgi:hypothetical protein
VSVLVYVCTCGFARDREPRSEEMNIVSGWGFTPFIDSSSGWFSIKSKWLPWVTGSSTNDLTARVNR